MQSLVNRQFRAVVPGILLSLLAVGTFSYILISKKLLNEFDTLLLAKSNGLIALTEDGVDGFEIERYEVTLPNYTNVENADYFEFITDPGKLIVKSLSLTADHRLPRIEPGSTSMFSNIKLPDGRAGRVMRTRFLPRVDFDDVTPDGGDFEIDTKILDFPGSANDARSIDEISGIENVLGAKDFRRVPITLQLASGRESLDSLIRSIQFLFLAAGLLTTCLILFILRRGTNQALEPLKNISSQVAKLDENQLNQKLVLHKPIAELNQLIERFNYLLKRLQDAFSREKQFTGDMAHELRTPISEIRSLLETQKHWPDDQEIQRNILADIDAATGRMQRTVQNMLVLTRAEGQVDELIESKDLKEIIVSRIHRLSNKAQTRNVDFSQNFEQSDIAVMGADQWVSIVDNLLTNAVAYSKQGSTIEVQLTKSTKPEKKGTLEIRNTVYNLEISDVSKMYKRLWQKDAARTSDVHSGLGLALVKAHADEVGAIINTSLDDDILTTRLLFDIIR